MGFVGEENGRPPVAIACQGGGSHTAFTAGALKRLLREDGYDFVALNGTSGGAICAFLAWHTLAVGGGFQKASELLDGFWEDNSAGAPHERFWNDWLVWVNRLQGSVYLHSVSPYGTPLAFWAQDDLSRALQRQVGAGDTGTPREDVPMLLVGAVDVLSGAFRAFNSRRDGMSIETILASTALPTLFRAVRTDGGVYWDGLFSHNPPVRELPDAGPDEIWVIQIDPEKREEEPTSIADILNELAGNVSLYQEVHSIDKINQFVEALGRAKTRAKSGSASPGSGITGRSRCAGSS